MESEIIRWSAHSTYKVKLAIGSEEAKNAETNQTKALVSFFLHVDSGSTPRNFNNRVIC